MTVAPHSTTNRLLIVLRSNISIELPLLRLYTVFAASLEIPRSEITVSVGLRQTDRGRVVAALVGVGPRYVFSRHTRKYFRTCHVGLIGNVLSSDVP